MASVAVRCPQCGSDEVIKRGKTDTGGQRYRCRNAVCAQGSFLLESRYQGYLPRRAMQFCHGDLSLPAERECLQRTVTDLLK